MQMRVGRHRPIRMLDPTRQLMIEPRNNDPGSRLEDHAVATATRSTAMSSR